MPKIIDLFAGAGGLSLGAARAGFDISAAVEIDEYALETHVKNFPHTRHLDRDVSKLTGKSLLELAGLKGGELDGLIGGPPCQGFSYMGKRNVDDDRNDLFYHFFRLVEEIAPAFFVAENVPGILSPQYNGIREKAFSEVRDRYVLLEPIEVKANEYGAPTTRTRIFFIGFDPKRITEMSSDMFRPRSNTELVPVLPALEGLPVEIDPHWISEESGWRKTEAMRESAFSRSISGRIPDGIGDSLSIDRYRAKNEVSGCMGTRHSAEVTARYEALEHGEQDKVSKAVRLHPERFCPTLRAGTGREKGSYQAVRPIHHVAPRVITPREAARLQGFPDWFVLHRTKWHSFRQIGNSVSPIVSEYLMSAVMTRLR